MLFNFKSTQQFAESIDIEHIGNVALKASDGLGNYYIYIVKTDNFGITDTLYYGPINNTPNPSNLTCYYLRSKFSYNSIKKQINSFLNDIHKKICEVEIIEDPKDALNECNSILDYYRGILDGEGSY